MKKSLKISIITTIAVFGLSLAVGYNSRLAEAATGNIYVSPSSKTVAINETFAVQLRINPGAAVDGVQASLAYDASKLSLVSVSGSGSPFTIELVKSTSPGLVKVERGILGSTVASDSLISTVTFKAVAAGSSGLTLSGVNATSAGSYTNPSKADGSVNIAAPVTPPANPTNPTTPPSTNNPTTPTTNPTSTNPTKTTTTSTNKPGEPSKNEPESKTDQPAAETNQKTATKPPTSDVAVVDQQPKAATDATKPTITPQVVLASSVGSIVVLGAVAAVVVTMLRRRRLTPAHGFGASSAPQNISDNSSSSAAAPIVGSSAPVEPTPPSSQPVIVTPTDVTPPAEAPISQSNPNGVVIEPPEGPGQ